MYPLALESFLGGKSFNMIWIFTVIYFVFCSMLFWLGFWFYGQALIYLGKRGFIVKNLGGIFVYMFFSSVLVAPLFVALGFIELWRIEFRSNLNYMIYFLFLFGLATAPGGIYFKKCYLGRLKKLGYFTSRY